MIISFGTCSLADSTWKPKMMVWTLFSSNFRLLVGFKPAFSLCLSVSKTLQTRLHGLLIMYSCFGLASKSEIESNCRCFQNSSRHDVPDASHIYCIALLNGHACELRSLLPSSSVRDLRMAAQRAFGQKHLRIQNYHRREASLSQFGANLRRITEKGRTVPYSSGTSTAAGSNKNGLCLVVSWR